MSYWANYVCDQHPNPFECPENLVVFDKTNRAYGLRVHDGGSSSISIRFCPWCGTDLERDNVASQLIEESNKATEMLVGKIVASVKVHRPSEVMTEFTDGTRFYADRTDEGLELSITEGKE